MKSFWYDILANLTSDVLFITVLFVFAWLLYFFTKRQKLYKFFCIADTKRLNVYLSRLDIQHGGALATNGTPGSYVGVTIVYNESMVANRFRDNFNYLSPSLSDKPGLLGKILFSDVTVRSIISVTSQNQIDTSTSFITLGGPTYNFVSDFIQNHAQSHVKFPPSGTSINISGLSPMTNLTYGFIQRIYDKKNTRSYFYAAGLNEFASVGATHFLAKNWNILFRKFKGESNFLIVIDFERANYNNWNIIHESSW